MLKAILLILNSQFLIRQRRTNQNSTFLILNYKYPFLHLLRVKAFMLVEEDKPTTNGKCRQGKDKTPKHAKNSVKDEEPKEGSTGGHRDPYNVAATKPEEFKGPLQPLENRVLRIIGHFRHSNRDVKVRLCQ